MTQNMEDVCRFCKMESEVEAEANKSEKHKKKKTKKVDDDDRAANETLDLSISARAAEEDAAKDNR